MAARFAFARDVTWEVWPALVDVCAIRRRSGGSSIDPINRLARNATRAPPIGSSPNPGAVAREPAISGCACGLLRATGGRRQTPMLVSENRVEHVEAVPPVRAARLSPGHHSAGLSVSTRYEDNIAGKRKSPETGGGWRHCAAGRRVR